MGSNASVGKLALSEEQQQLLALLLEEQGLTTAAPPAIMRRSPTVSPPLSFAQERLWFLQQLEAHTALYNIPMALRWQGPLNAAVLERSLSEIVRRHEVLRATFQSVAGQPVQHIMPARPMTLPVCDMRQPPPAEQERTIQRRLLDEAQRAFDLSQGPLLRAELVCLSDQDHVLFLTMHHIVADGFSYTIFMNELKILYSSFVQGKAAPLPELTVQFADFAAWQRAWLQGEVLAAQLGYWRKQLADAPAVLDLPTDYRRPPVQRYNGAQQLLTLAPALTDAIKQMSRRRGVTLFTTLLAAFKILLYRYSGQLDIVVGTPVANRNVPGIDGLIGLFINTLVLRSNLAGNPTFDDLVGQVGTTVLEAYDHQELPFEKLVEVLQPARDVSRSPLFQVMFNFQHALTTRMELDGVGVTLLEQPAGLAKFDLLMDIKELEGQLVVTLEYATDLFKAATIIQMLTHYQVLLEGIVADPAQGIATLPLLTAAERQHILSDWNANRLDYPREQPIHHLFETVAEQSPDVCAVVAGEQRLTYGELNRRANQVADTLRELGVGPEVRVGVFMQRSPDIMVALLGILKAGGAYVPLDPHYPAERLQFMLQDARIEVLLTQAALVTRLPAYAAQTVCLDRDWPEIARHADTNLRSGVTGEHLAYVIYTSGSTGQPKGVAIAHRNTMALLCWARDVFTPINHTGMLAATSICFDLSVFELFVPLSWGGTLILVEDALALPTLPPTVPVSLVNTVPSAMAELVRTGSVPSSVRTINLAGEALPLELVQRLYEQTAVEQVCNLYGPTEDTTYSTWAVVEAGAPLVPIGRPLPNTQVYLLDAQMQPVPVGVPGELYLAGDGLARGYLQRPALTAERFLPNPFGPAGSRMYRTGDLARYQPDGVIVYLGRNDQQIKLRGYRIEPGEVEAMLIRHPAIAQAVVVTGGSGGSDQRLVAYLVLKAGHIPTFSELRTFLREKLPAPMVPSAFVVLAALPLTPNGKIDRKALQLQTQDATAAEPEHPFVAPRNATEEALTQIWMEVLRRDRIGIHDNFFELGGHSLLATQIMARVEDGLQVKLPLQRLFETPTIAALAGAIMQQRDEGGSDGAATPLITRRNQVNTAELFASIDHLADAEVDALLRAILPDEAGAA